VTKKDATRFGSAQRDERPVLIKLSGAFDIRYRSTIEDTLRGCLASGRAALVDLSEITFMESRCLRELAVHYQLGGGRMVLCDPSEDMEVSVAACDMEHWLDFVHTAGFRHPPDHVAAGLTHNTAMKKGKEFAHANIIFGSKPQETRRPDLDRRGIRGVHGA
jgi:anti-anti-sigma factor